MLTQPISPLKQYTRFEEIAPPTEGLLAQNKIGVLALAGGMGSRLRFEQPKGCFPISVIKEKSLFQLLCEKVQAASQHVKVALQLAILTSDFNDYQTQAFFIENHFFGLDSSQVHFFCQPNLPLLDLEGNHFLQSPGKVATGPGGNGAVFKYFVESGIWQKWNTLGIEIVNLLPIDNPLVDPFDEILATHHFRNQNEVTIKAATRVDPYENVGLICQQDKSIKVVEYSELSLEQRSQELHCALANLGLYTFSMEFIDSVSKKDLPVHRALKAVKKINHKGEFELPTTPNAYKLESFIFDLFAFSRRSEVVCCPRQDYFAALKNFQGPDSIQTVKEALLTKDRKLLSKMVGGSVPDDFLVELDPSLYYKSKGRKGLPANGSYVN